MASDQLSRRENSTSEREVHLEENRVPKMATHFESLAEKSKQLDSGAGRQFPHRECHELGGKFGDINVSATIVAKTEGDDVGIGRGKHCEERTREPNYAIGKFEVCGGPGQQIRGASMESQGFKHEKTGGNRQDASMESRGFKHDKIGGNRQERGASMESKAKHEQSAGASMESTGKRESDKGRRHSKEKAGERRNIDKEEGGEKREQLSLEEISNLRGTAQQNSTETLRAAEERYNKGKESASQALNTAAEYNKDKGQQASETARQSAQYAAEKGGQAKNTIVEGAKKTSRYIAEKGTETKDTAAETLSSAGRTTADYTVPKMEQAKDYALQTAVKAKDTAVDVTKTVASYTGEKSVAAKDVTVEKSKEAAGLAGKVAVDVKDRAVVAGWSAAHYTTEKAVEGTKVAARLVEGAAEYAGQKSKELAATSLRAAKDAASAAGETITEYTARKKEEAARDFEAKRSTEETPGEYISYQEEEEESRERPSETRRQVEDFPRKTKERIKETAKPIGDALKQSFQGSSETNKYGGFTQETERRRHDEREKGPVQTEGVETERNFEGSARRGDGTESGVLGAIAETIVEIAQNTTNLVNIGPDVDHDDQPETQRGSGGTISNEHGADATTFRRGKLGIETNLIYDRHIVCVSFAGLLNK